MKRILHVLAVGPSLALAFGIAISPVSHAGQRCSASSVVAPSFEARSSFARSLQEQLAQQGVSAHVTVEGQERNQLRIEWPDISRHAIYDLVISPAIRDQAKPLGLKTIVFADGGGSRHCGALAKADCEERWDYDLNRESMIWHPSQL
ncbi:MAG TPA: hypothetical protein VEI01_08155 [Terriglobales bacterium]|nr:hypothetical protein [Terriglobales bacterium]